MNHTPGPWQQHAPRIDGKIDQTYREITAWNGFHPEGFGLSGFMSEADARLIACAPELLEALRGLAYPGPHEGQPSEADRIATARAVIAKAEGA